MLGKCNCGREGRYTHTNELGEYEMSCNKYSVCKTYEELEKELNKYKSNYKTLLEASEDLLLYREGTESYNTARIIVKEMGKCK